MDEDQLNDLKQFIANTISQTEVRLTGRIDGLEGRIDGLEGRIGGLEGRIDGLGDGMSGLEQRVAGLEHEVRDGFAGIGEVIEQLNQRLDDREKEVNKRLTKLEGQVAA